MTLSARQKGVNFASRFTINGQTRPAPTETAPLSRRCSQRTTLTTTSQNSRRRIDALLTSLSDVLPFVTLTANATRASTSCGSRSSLSVVTERNRSSISGCICGQVEVIQGNPAHRREQSQDKPSGRHVPGHPARVLQQLCHGTS